jgi:hypothetical protein
MEEHHWGCQGWKSAVEPEEEFSQSINWSVVSHLVYLSQGFSSEVIFLFSYVPKFLTNSSVKPCLVWLQIMRSSIFDVQVELHYKIKRNFILFINV